MCGIVGYIGEKQAAPVLLDGLSKLEYRGYDSAGVAVFDGNKINIEKSKGRLSVLSDMIDGGKKLIGSCGIGHTRWATHGEPSDVNSHPHTNKVGNIAIVHNGIIENYMKLKAYLISKGYEFVSETDTEVIAHLADYYYKGDILDTVIKIINKVEGSYALGIISSDHPDEIIAVRKDSPLIVGLGEGENFIASDIPAILKYTKNVYLIEDNEIAHIKKSGVTLYNTDKEVIEKEVFEVNWDITSAEKGGYEHFMFKEIMEEPQSIANTVNPVIKQGLIKFKDIPKKLHIVACGSAYHVGVVGKYVIEKLAKIPVEVDIASEYRYRDPILTEDTLVVIISQSGETADTLAALRDSKKRGAKIFGIVNVVGSSIARESDEVLYWQVPKLQLQQLRLTALSLLQFIFSPFRLQKQTAIFHPRRKKRIAMNLCASPNT